MVVVLEKGRSLRKGKQRFVTFTYRGVVRTVHFGDPRLREFPGTKRGDRYCARSFGILTKDGRATRDDPLSPNYWSRKDLWRCKGKKSMKK